MIDGGIPLAGYGQGAIALAGLDFPTKFRSFDGPVLLLNGAEDRLNPDAAVTPTPKLPAAETTVVPEAGQLITHLFGDARSVGSLVVPLMHRHSSKLVQYILGGSPCSKSADPA
jgi:hypothetical protein